MNARRQLRRKIERKQRRLNRLLIKARELRAMIEYEVVDLEKIGSMLEDHERNHPITGENVTNPESWEDTNDRER